MADELGEREREVLRAIVQEYITTGSAVGSSQLAQRPEFDVSPATVRNVMADLEALGFLEKPHTSAGRVPTDRGFRLYVDALLQIRPPSSADWERIERVAQPGAEAAGAALLENTAELLHSL